MLLFAVTVIVGVAVAFAAPTKSSVWMPDGAAVAVAFPVEVSLWLAALAIVDCDAAPLTASMLTTVCGTAVAAATAPEMRCRAVASAHAAVALPDEVALTSQLRGASVASALAQLLTVSEYVATV